MSPRSLLLALPLLGLLAAPTRAQTVVLENPFPALSFSNPVELMDAGDGMGYLYVVEQAGRIRVFENDAAVTEAPLFLDLTDRVVSGGEMGLLGLAFDPDYAANGYLYVDYTLSNPLRTRISRFSRSATTPPEADPGSEVVLLEVGQPYANHNAGAIAFGPPEGPVGARYLYVTLGDGGDANDPDENGQDPSTLLGSILRLDVHGGGSALDCGAGTGAATVPPSNPFLGVAGHCDEIYAYGFRNPWRMRFDEAGGWALWVGDVGQGQWEEIDVVAAGGNYGWDMYEGNHCFEGPCAPAGKTFPVWEYSHASGNCSVTGGYVYRGEAIPELVGKYLFGDYCSGRIWALTPGASPTVEQVASYPGLTSFGEDAAGELYALSAGGVRRFLRDPPVSSEPPPPVEAALTVVGPNPARARVAVRFTAQGAARLTLHDALGRRVAVLYEGTGLATPREAVVSTAALAPGVYVLRLATGGTVTTQELTVVR